MLFKNETGGSVKIRLGDSEDYFWKTIKPEQEIELDESHGKAVGFTALEPKAQEKEPEKKRGKKDANSGNKAEERTKYRERLLSVEGVGKKTAEDIMAIYPKKEDLTKALKEKAEIPVRDDISKALKRKFR